MTLKNMKAASHHSNRMNWRSGQPCDWIPDVMSLDVDPAVRRLVIVSDLHGFREPLDAVDACLSRFDEPFAVFANGDLFEGGFDAKATIDWVRGHATGRTTRGNHDSRIFAYLADQVAGEPPVQWAPDAELGGYRTLDADDLRFVAELPDQLVVRWRGRSIRLMHGHQSPTTPLYTDWRSTPDEITRLFLNLAFDLTIVGHTHHPFIRRQSGSIVANSGSVSVPILRYRDGNGDVIDRDGFPIDSVVRKGESSFLVITESSGELNPELVKFDYDRLGMLKRYEGHKNLNTPLAQRKKWVLEHFFDSALADGGC
jgi:predicted phosphodiesterase